MKSDPRDDAAAVLVFFGFLALVILVALGSIGTAVYLSGMRGM